MPPCSAATLLRNRRGASEVGSIALGALYAVWQRSVGKADSAPHTLHKGWLEVLHITHFTGICQSKEEESFFRQDKLKSSLQWWPPKSVWIWAGFLASRKAPAPPTLLVALPILQLRHVGAAKQARPSVPLSLAC